MTTKRVSIRMSAKLHTAATKRAQAAGRDLPQHVRALLEADAGLQCGDAPGELPRGMAALPAKRRREAQAKSVEARARNQVGRS